MRTLTVVAIGAAALVGSSAMTLSSHASRAHGAGAHARSTAGAGGRSSAAGGIGGSSTGGSGVACGGLDLFIAVTQLPLHANAANNLGGGQLQLGNGLGGLDNVFAPVGAPAGGGGQSTSQGVTTLSGSDGAADSGDTGNAACGNGGRGGRGARGGTAHGGHGGAAGAAAARGGAARSATGD